MLELPHRCCFNAYPQTTVKFLNFRMPKNFAVIYLKFKHRGQTLGYFVGKMQMEKQTEDPDQTAPRGAVWSWSALFDQTYLSENLGSLWYVLEQK